MLPSTIATLNTATFTFTEPNRCQRIEDIMALKREKREEECATMVCSGLKKTQLLKGERRQGQFCHFQRMLVAPAMLLGAPSNSL